MKYWGFLAAKLVAAGGLLLLIRGLIRWYFAKPAVFLGLPSDPFAHDLTYTTVMMLFSLFCFGLVYLAVLDQRYRCRTCLRRLRMPLNAGSWPNSFLKGRPRIEYICPYGHGTLRVPEEQVTGPATPDWHKNEDIWKELESLEETRR